jgi:hypothetical protein
VVGEDDGQQALGSPRTLSRVGLGRAPKASLVGAKTVMPWALSTRSAFLTAVTSVDSLGHYTVAAIARTLGVSRASIYRNLAEPRS